MLCLIDPHAHLHVYVTSSFPIIPFKQMPRPASKQSAIDKTLKYLRRVQTGGQVSLKFTNYDSKNCIIYKLNKYHYLDTELYVIDMQAIKEMSRLFSKPNNVELVHLDLCNLGDEELLEFVKGNWSNLRFLSLSNNGIKCRGIDALAKAKLPQLRQINLSDNGLNGEAVMTLKDAAWGKLQKLNLNFNCLNSQGILSIQGAKWRGLKVLSLLSNGINNRAACVLSRMPMPYLDQILLSHNQLTDDSAPVLAKAHWPQLKTLDLDGNFIGDSGVKALARLSCYKLQRLHLFQGKTVIINRDMEPKVLPTMGGLKQLVHGHFEHLRVEIHQGKLGEVSKGKFIRSAPLTDMMHSGHIEIALLSLGKSAS